MIEAKDESFFDLAPGERLSNPAILRLRHYEIMQP
jgi:hypothetical protein